MQPYRTIPAALALGESRQASAFEVLHDWCEGVLRSPQVYTGLTALALLRTGPAIDYLISLVTDGPVSAARAAMNALQVYKDDPQVWQGVTTAANQRSDLKP